MTQLDGVKACPAGRHEAADLVIAAGDAHETRAYAESLGQILPPGAVVCLIGNLGAGKTTFTQGLARGLGLPPEEPVNSPTFTLIAEHAGGRIPLYHFDVYRLDDESGLYDIAFDEYLAEAAAVVIEWADKVTAGLPDDRLEITLAFASGDENGRELAIRALGEQSRRVLDQWRALIADHEKAHP